MFYKLKEIMPLTMNVDLIMLKVILLSIDVLANGKRKNNKKGFTK